jgi:sigma-B regulation protein RsbU (phosphoserine phosphatase)
MYDVYTDGRTLRGISLFDVSGHGISSALLTMIIKPIAFRAFNDLKKSPLDGVFETVERRLAREIPESETMISWALLRTSGNTVEYINAGHPNLLHRDRKTGQTGIVDLGGKYYKSRPLGTGLFGPPPLVIKFRTAPGDFLVLYTDCLLESRNAGNEIFGIDRIIDSLNRTPGGTANEIVDHLIAEFNSFIDHKRVRDDLTVIVARKK